MPFGRRSFGLEPFGDVPSGSGTPTLALSVQIRAASTSKELIGATTSLATRSQAVATSRLSISAATTLRTQIRQTSATKTSPSATTALQVQIRQGSRISNLFSGSILNLLWVARTASRNAATPTAKSALATRIQNASRTQTGMKATTQLSTQMRSASSLRVANWGSILQFAVRMAASSRAVATTTYTAVLSWHSQQASHTQTQVKASAALTAQMRSASSARSTPFSVTGLIARVFGFSWIKNKLVQGGIALPAQCVVSDAQLYSVAVNDNVVYSAGLSDEVVNA